VLSVAEIPECELDHLVKPVTVIRFNVALYNRFDNDCISFLLPSIFNISRNKINRSMPPAFTSRDSFSANNFFSFLLPESPQTVFQKLLK
jgi:hypothetical protein